MQVWQCQPEYERLLKRKLNDSRGTINKLDGKVPENQLLRGIGNRLATRAEVCIKPGVFHLASEDDDMSGFAALFEDEVAEKLIY